MANKIGVMKDMLTLRHVENKDYLEVINILKFHRLEDDLSQGIIYILENENEIIGVGKILLKDDYGIFKYIFVKDDYQGFDFGDSILRGMLFKCQSLGVKNVYYWDYNSYLIKKGFKYKDKVTFDNYHLYLKVNDFFKKSCCGD